MNQRQNSKNVAEQFIGRWSPRAFVPEEITEQQLIKTLEAARWAPSAFNNQPWRFVYVMRDSIEWDNFLDTLIEFNQNWAKHSSALVFVFSKITSVTKEGKEVPSATHAFEAGMATSNMLHQAHLDGLHTHGMTGFDEEKIRCLLQLPKKYAVQAVFAIGKHTSDLSAIPQYMHAGEVASDRKPLAEIVAKEQFDNLDN